MKMFFKSTRFGQVLFMGSVDAVSVIFLASFSYFTLPIFMHDPVRGVTYNFTFFVFPVLMAVIYPLVLYILGLYEFQAEIRKQRLLKKLILSGFLSCAVFLLADKIFGVTRVKFPLLLFFGFSVFYFYFQRLFVFKKILSFRMKKKGILFIGRDALTKHIEKRLTENAGYDIRGFIAGENQAAENDKSGAAAYGDLKRLITEKNVKMLILAMDRQIPLPLLKTVYKYSFESVSLYRSDSFYEFLTRKFAIEQFLQAKNTPFLDMQGFASPVYRRLKRLIDFAGSITALILLLPVFFAIALLVKITSKGPAFYLQERLGFQEKPFKLIKFRTMVEGAEKANGPQWARRGDSRVTRVGRILRKTRLDELPQLLNVLKGDMSFVGPRAFRKHFVDIFEEKVPFYTLKFCVKPGLTGWAQVNHYYRCSEQTFQDNIERLQYDLYYIKHASLLFDMLIIIKTFQTIVCRPAY